MADRVQQRYDIVIVGGGIAGVTAARTIAESEASASTLLVSGEDRPPYKRTKISKNVASGFSRDAFAIEPSEWYADHGIDLLIGTTVDRIDPTTHRVSLSDGRSVEYGAVILATGGEAVRPAEADHPRVHTVRAAGDVGRLLASTTPSDEILVVGMGVLGVELAEQLALRGARITLLGRSRVLMPRELNDEAAARLDRLFRDAGVALEYGSTLSHVSVGEDGLEAMWRDRRHRFDHIIYSIGMRPAGTLAVKSGIPTATGILVDHYLETGVAGIYAAGDVAEQHDGYRTHLWHAAEHQGEIAARNALGETVRFDRPNFRLKCEVFGHYFFSAGKPEDPSSYPTVEHDDGTRYLCFYLQNGTLAGMVMVDDKPNAKAYQRAVREGCDLETLRSEFLGSPSSAI